MASTLSVGSGRIVTAALLLTAAFATSSCALNNRAKGAAVGGAAGAAVGGVIGNQTGSTARGAIIGAVVGGAAGAVIGHQMDRQVEELEVAIPGATVTRIGEGMVVMFDSGLLYDFDSSGIRPAAGLNLQALATSLKKYGNTELLIIGHTDTQGTTAYNQDLSTRRAESALHYLANEGVAMVRMSTEGRGELEAIATNDTDAGRQLNRRIEVAIYANAASRTSSK